METTIVNFLRILPRAKNSKTGEIATFPLFHVLVEKISEDEFSATSMEYFQLSVKKTPEDAVLAIYQKMVNYFLMMIDRYGAESLSEVVKLEDYSALWGRVREFSLKKYINDLKYVEMTLKGESIENLKTQSALLLDKTEIKTAMIKKEDHDKIVAAKDSEIEHKNNLLAKIHERYEQVLQSNEELMNENTLLKLSQEISTNSWRPELLSNTISESSSACA